MSTGAASRPLRASAKLVGVTLASLLAVACGSGSSTGGPSGGTTPPASGADIQLTSKATLGNYLVAGGKTLYYFGLDLPGTAAQGPVSNCTAAGGCLSLWPIFDVGNPTLATGLQASDFAQFTRPDGAKQTTFRGWPLYFYAGDAAAGDTTGDNFEAWYVIREPFYSLLAMTKSATGLPLYLADPQGRTVYVFAADSVGTAGASPVSACTGSCLTTWPIFLADGTVTPTGVDATRLSTFTRADGTLQTAFDGHPLYYYVNDTVPGATGGNNLDSFGGVWNLLDPNSASQ